MAGEGRGDESPRSDQGFDQPGSPSWRPGWVLHMALFQLDSEVY